MTAATSPEEQRRLTMTSASMRVVLGLAALSVLPLAYPQLGALRTLMGAYVVVSAVALWLIHRGVGGRPRAVISGVVDLLTLTWAVHAVGSTQTALLSVYVLAAVLNVLVAGAGVGALMAALGSVLYGVMLLSEQVGWLAPPPGEDAIDATISWSLVTALTVVATWVVGNLVSRIRRHESALARANHELERTNAALQEANERLAQLSKRDPLTGLYNRRELMDRLEDELRHVRRGRAVCFLMADLDGFKRVNDLHGHATGDAMLCAVAKTLGEAVREGDVLGRYGGDELAIVLPDTEREAAERVAERVVHRIRELGRDYADDTAVTVSAGLSVAKRDDDTTSLVRRADAATYEVKRDGGDGYRVG